MTPVIIVYGLPKSAPNLREELQGKLISAIAGIRDINTSTDQIFVFFPADLVPDGLGEELIAFIDGVDYLPPRTSREKTENPKEMRISQETAKAVTDVLWEYAENNLPQCRFVKTFIRPYDMALWHSR